MTEHDHGIHIKGLTAEQAHALEVIADSMQMHNGTVESVITRHGESQPNVPTENWPVNWASRAVEQGLEQCANWGTAYNSTMPMGVSNQCERPSGHLQHGVPDHATLPSNLPGYQWR